MSTQKEAQVLGGKLKIVKLSVKLREQTTGITRVLFLYNPSTCNQYNGVLLSVQPQLGKQLIKCEPKEKKREQKETERNKRKRRKFSTNGAK